MNKIYKVLRYCAVFVLAMSFAVVAAFAEDKVYPDKPNPPRLVNDFAHVLSNEQVQELEQRLEDYANSSSSQISIITMTSLGGHDISEYSVHVFNDWGLGQEKKNNGVLILLALDDGYGKPRAWITVGKGLQGVLTDARSGQIFRNQMVPEFKQKNYYQGLSDAADAVIAVTKDEYTSEEGDTRGDSANGREEGSRKVPVIAIIITIIVIISITRGGRGGRRGGGGGGGLGDIATGIIIGNLLSGGRRGGGDWGGGGSWGGGGFGGFGGGSTDGGGAGGSW